MATGKSEKLMNALRHCLGRFQSAPDSWTHVSPTDEEPVDVPDELAPLPHMIFLTLVKLLDFKFFGPAEKVAWTIPVSYDGIPLLLSHRKFGFRLHCLPAARPGQEVVQQVMRELNRGIRIADALLQPCLEDQVQAGNVTIVNSYHQLSRMYAFFRSKAAKAYDRPSPKPTVLKRDADGKPVATHHDPFRYQFQGFWYAFAMIDAYFSRLEHLLILMLPFCGFDPKHESLCEAISSQWGSKFKRLFNLDNDDEARSY